MKTIHIVKDQEIPARFEEKAPDFLRNDPSSSFDPGVMSFMVYTDEPKTVWKPFKTWSLFLVANATWLSPSSAAKLLSLYDSYMGFARAIGNDHAAVWFGKPITPEISDPGEGINVTTCLKYCSRYKLDPLKSPHILVTTNHPGKSGAPLQHYVLVELCDLKAQFVQEFLTLLAAQIGTAQLNSETIDSDRWWLTLKQAFSNALHEFGQIAGKITVSISAGPLKVTIEPK